MKDYTARLWLSPVSPEVMHAIYAAAAHYPSRVGMMCSCSQVCDGAYTGLDFETFTRLRADYERRYCRVFVERDHLGKGGEDPYVWCQRDVSYGFDGAMLHLFDADAVAGVVDRFAGQMKWNVGPGEDDSQALRPSEAEYWVRAAPHAHWFSFPTGCRIDGLGNRGEFDDAAMRAMKDCFPDVRMRAHNCDYLDMATLTDVAAATDGVNVAPQLGVVQSSWYLTHALSYGLDVRGWTDACWADDRNRGRWSRHEWDVVHAVGHYHLDAIEWRRHVANGVTFHLTQYIKTLARYVL